MPSPLRLTRRQILVFRRRVGVLDERLPYDAASLRRAAWAGLQDSMPRAALLALHARVRGVPPTVLDDPALAQLWGPRHSVYVVAARDFAVFSLGRHPEGAKARARAECAAERLQAYLRGGRETHHAIGRGLGIDPNSLKHGATTGTIAIRWDGARSPLVWTSTLLRSTRRTRAASWRGAICGSSGRRRRRSSPSGPGWRNPPRLWTSRVWPGALLVDGEVRGTWRRDGQVVSVDVWSRLGARRRAAVAGEAVALPVAVGRAIEVIWS